MVEELDVVLDKYKKRLMYGWQNLTTTQYQMKRISKKDKPHFGCQLPFTPL